MRVLVTGASGYVGGAMAERLVRAGHQVMVTRHSREVPIEGVEEVDCDIRDPEQVRSAVNGVGTVVHCAALVGAGHDAADLMAVNLEGTRNLMEACCELDVGHVVHVSSTCVMDEYIDHHGSDESHPYPSEVRDAYTRSKVEAERLALACSDRLDVTVLRPGWVWGPDAPGMRGLIMALDRALLAVPGKGDNALHLVFRDNLASVIDGVVERPVPGTYIITDGPGTDLRTFTGCIGDALGREPRVLRIPFGLMYHLSSVTEPLARSMGVGLPTRLQVCNLGRHHDFDNGRSRDVLGYESLVGLEEGVARTVARYRGTGP
jgi:nucleoside-diphosphate-sugar epimerase